MAGVYSVKQINSYIKHMFSQDFALGNVHVRGEVSNCKYHTSGHIYFTLKDESGVLACVMFAGNSRSLKFRLKEGQMVIALGSVGVYERDGTYQLYTKQIVLDGSGQLYERYEELKKELEEIGLFDPAYKKPLPSYACKIGIVTAKTGAAIHDICNIAARRNPYVRLYLYNALVQGEGAADSILAGIRTLDEMNLDVIIVGRGGGSIEDLWAFNEEKVAYGIFQCRTPVISAVGHETDVTIADFVADRRAPTPSAAAELAVFEYSKFLETMSGNLYHLNAAMNRALDQKKSVLERNILALRLKAPDRQLKDRQNYLEDMDQRMLLAARDKLQAAKHRLEMAVQRLESVSPGRRLGMGYVFAADENRSPLDSASQLRSGDIMEIYFKDGLVKAKVLEISKEQ